MKAIPWSFPLALLVLFLALGCVAPMATPTAAPPPTQSPINILFAVHIEPFLPTFGFDYGARREELYWLRDLALAHNAKLTVASNGEFMEYVEDFGDQALVQSYLNAGFDWGTHIHPLWRRSRHDWVKEPPDASEEKVRRIWQDNIRAVNAIIGAENNYGAAPYQTHQPLMVALRHEYDFHIETALTETPTGNTSRPCWTGWTPTSWAKLPLRAT